MHIAPASSQRYFAAGRPMPGGLHEVAVEVRPLRHAARAHEDDALRLDLDALLATPPS